jgi:PAS domain S-box-containing protein
MKRRIAARPPTLNSVRELSLVASRNGASPPPPRKAKRRHVPAELEQAIQRYVDLFELAPIGYVAFDRVGRIEEINLAAATLLGWKRHRLIGAPFALCVARSDMQFFLHHLLRCRSSESFVQTELHLKKVDGGKLHVLLSSTPTYSSMRDGVGLYQTAIIDLTEREEGEKALRESEELHRALVSQMAVGMSRTDLKGRIVFANKKFCEMLDSTEPELKEKTIFDITHPADVRYSKDLFQRLIKQRKPYRLEKRYVRADGTRFWVDVSASPIRDPAGKTQGAVSVIIDISDRRRAQAALEEAKASLESRVKERTAELLAANQELQNQITRRKRLEGEILEISDREQRRLGQDLHDSLCQHLTATAFMARAVALRLRKHRVIDAKDIDKIADFINQGVSEARTVARGLHPVEMDAVGLVNALRTLANRGRGQTQCIVEADENLEIADPTVALHLFRIAREAVNNAYKHARAREILVRLRASRRFIELSVTDDGVGLPPNFAKGSGMGFHIINYRAHSIGAKLEIKPNNSQGTAVICRLPHK